MKNSLTGIVILTLVLLALHVSGQTRHEDEYLPPSPTVAGLGKYINDPINLGSGTPDISIPLCEVSAGNYKMPISLSYHAGGIRVAEEASWAGLSWSLIAGGVITRTIKHLADNVHGTREPFFDTYGGLPLPYAESDYYDLWVLGTQSKTKDGLPDVFSYTFPGHNGQFLYIDDESILMPRKPLTITRDHNRDEWTIVDEHGVKYQFTEKETSLKRESATENNVISWYLTEIRTPTGESIKFTYKNTSFREAITIVESKTYIHDFANTYVGPKSDIPITEVYGRELETIEFPLGTVNFSSTYDREDIDKKPTQVGALRLTGITVKNNNNEVKKWFSLTQDYFGSGNSFLDKRLRLLAVRDMLQESEYRFEYNTGVSLPSKTSRAQDHWGYYNGKNSNQSLAPDFGEFTQNNFCSASTHTDLDDRREPDSTKVMAGMLTKITYPTGGYTQYEYQGNDYHVDDYTVTTYSSSSGTSVSAAFTGPKNKEITFTLPTTTCVEIDVNIIIEAPGGNESSTSQAKVEIIREDVENPGIIEPVVVATYKREDNGENFLQLSGGPEWKYTLRATATMSNSTVTATYYKHPVTTKTMRKKYTGGVRVKRIVQHDGKNPDMIRRFIYNGGVSNGSSGMVVGSPEYINISHSYTEKQEPHHANCEMWELNTFTNVHSNTIHATGDGTLVGYSNVKTLYGDAGEGGYNISTFNTSMRNSWERGTLLTSTDYDSEGRRIKEIINTYDSWGTQLYFGLRVTVDAAHPCATSTYNVKYDVYFDQEPESFRSENFTQTSQTTTTYNADTGESTTLTEEYFYDNPEHLQVTRSYRTENTRKLVTFASFPSDFSNTSGFINALKVNHIIAPIETVTWQENLDGTNARILSGNISTYLSNGLVESVYKLETAAPIPVAGFKFANRVSGKLPPDGIVQDFGRFAGYGNEPRITFTYKDNRPSQITPTDGAPTTYLWGYNKQFPIAKIENAAAAHTAYTGFENDNEGNWDDYTANSTDARTGTKAFVGTLSISDLPQDDYLVTAWAKDGTGTPAIAGLTPTYVSSSENGWTLYQWHSSLSGTVSINSNGATIDDVRLHPYGSLMTTLTYEPLRGTSSVTDSNNITIYYKYDLAGRLGTIKDQDDNIVKYYNYQYVQQQ